EIGAGKRAWVALSPGVISDPQLGGEAGGFVLPVEYERAGHDNDRRQRPVACVQLTAGLEKGQHHDRLAEPHIVGEATAELKSTQEIAPAEALAPALPPRASERALRDVALQ